MEDQEVLGEKDEEVGSFKVSDFVHDQHILINDDHYDIHEDRSVRRRRGTSETLAGKQLSLNVK